VGDVQSERACLILLSAGANVVFFRLHNLVAANAIVRPSPMNAPYPKMGFKIALFTSKTPPTSDPFRIPF
jgi:hypothetical protein